ncbi:hypothetical protein HOO65_100006 [Ceratocystis lukuohia]|uniref:Reverse transcriptase domain-containing protein n=1 Tax=Ceratocystis lukuohia TaxID=2019550 RepID=A0ABR4M8K9_9PEZI
MMPFGLSNGSAVFQRYVNWVLRNYLDNFCSAYVDDILIYTNGTKQEHQEHVLKVLAELEKAGLQLDVDKCEFEVKKTKYLGFIIEVGKGISMDPRKVEAISTWEAPKTVKGVRSFLGFANFYRTFIKNFAELAAPLMLKDCFCHGGLLAGWDPDLDADATVVESDASGFGIGGRLSQNGLPVAFFSRKMNEADRNYPIHDKELLGVIGCFKEWYPMLRGLVGFNLITDHKNLEYFAKKQLLNERQVRWSEFLQSLPPFKVTHRPGRLNQAADALSRREQDEPEDPREGRELQLWKPLQVNYLHAMPTQTPSNLFEKADLQNLWEKAVKEDTDTEAIWNALRNQDSTKMPKDRQAVDTKL